MVISLKATGGGGGGGPRSKNRIKKIVFLAKVMIF